ncbi:MAG: class I SAM-dependent DNA methyltransferase [Candidatus Thorarchaeota archaeon]
MVKVLNPSDKKDLDFDFINKTIIKLKKILIKHEIQNELEYKIWQKDFERIYSKKEANIHLYIVTSLIYFVGHVFISKFILENEELVKFHQESLKGFKSFEIDISKRFESLKIFELKYFIPLFSISEKENLSYFHNLILDIADYIFKLEISPEYIFDYLIQTAISPLIRHKSGEYYTPQFLVKKMITEAYNFGESVLDPCCGSGNFLTETVKHILSQDEPIERKISAINNIYGYDINPISIYVSKLNLFYLVKDLTDEIHLHLYVLDFLFHKENEVNIKYDLVIGNPPWYTYRDIETIEYQNKVKRLSEQLDVKPLPKNLLNLEISTLFFVKANRTFMKEKAKIFFVITKGVITGSHASRFRNFKGFSNLKIWTFDRKIEALFNIDFICIFGQKSQVFEKTTTEIIKAYHFKIKSNIEKIGYFEDLELKLDRVDLLIPYSVEEKGGKRYTKKLISQVNLKSLYKLEESHYKKYFHKGADLNPRNLIFIKPSRVDNSLVKINPDLRIFKRAKAPWNKIEFENEIIESKYIFKVVKSTELVKFHIYDYYHVFLPFTKTNFHFDYDELEKYGKLFYDKINQVYIKYKKKTTKHRSLIENLDRWSKLINKRQLSKIKVVYNNSGAILYSAVVQGDFLITGDLSFYDTDNLEEAFYLSAILNSTMMTKQVDIIRSSRHIFKLPLEFPIKKFDKKNPNHQKLAELGKKGQEIAKKIIQSHKEMKERTFTKARIQININEKLKPIFSQIDELLLNQLQESKNLK